MFSAAVVLICALVWSVPTRAQTDNTPEECSHRTRAEVTSWHRTVVRGRRALVRQRFDEAATHWHRARQVCETPELLVWLARAEAGRGHRKVSKKLRVLARKLRLARATRRPDVLELAGPGWRVPSARAPRTSGVEVLSLSDPVGPVAPLPAPRQAPVSLGLGEGKFGTRREPIDLGMLRLQDPREPLLARGADVISKTRTRDGATLLTVMTTPEGALVAIHHHRELAGHTPMRARPVSPELTYVLVISKPGFAALRRTVTTVRGMHHMLFIQLEKL